MELDPVRWVGDQEPRPAVAEEPGDVRGARRVAAQQAMVAERVQLTGLDPGLVRYRGDLVGVDEPGLRLAAREVAQEREQRVVVHGHVGQELVELRLVGGRHRADRIEGREDERLLVGREVDVQDGDGRLVPARASATRAWPSTTKPVRRLTRTCWTQPTASSAPASASCCAFGWTRQLPGLARSWSGASSPAPTMRLRQAGDGVGAVALVAVRRLTAARGPTWAPTGQPGWIPDQRPGQFAKPGRVHTVGRRSQRSSRVAIWATPPRSVDAPFVELHERHSTAVLRDVERRTASGERDDVVDGQVGGSVGGALVARAPVAVLATPGAEDAGAETLPGPRAVESVVAAAVGLAGVLGAATTRAARDDTTDRAQLHPRIVVGAAGAVYSLGVLRLRDQPSERTGRPGAVRLSPDPRPASTVTGDGRL